MSGTKALQSPYLFALLVGLHPVLFYISNNWFVFPPFISFGIVLIVPVLIFLSLGLLQVVLSTLQRIPSNGFLNQLPNRLFAFLGLLAWFYLLREPLLGNLNNDHGVFLGLALLLSGVISWNIQKLQYGHINQILVVLCILSVGSGVFSILQEKPWEPFNPITPLPNQELLDRIEFKKTPNVYYIIPDGYPSREALEKIFDIDNMEFYRRLEDAGFSTTHSAYSNYISTLASVTSLLGMGHHYYKSSLGLAEMLGGRELIAGRQNPTTSIFKRNGYQIHHLHQKGILLYSGCFVDSCSPNVAWEDALELLVPFRLKSKLGLVTDITLSGFKKRMLRHITKMSEHTQPSFTFVHYILPSHSPTKIQTFKKLASFRENYGELLQKSNSFLLGLMRAIITNDPNALIIFNSDHGGFGLGWYGLARKEVFTGLSKDLTVLDHMGVLLTIKWPTPPQFSEPSTTTNVNIFRSIFAYLSEDERVLTTTVPNNSYLRMGSDIIYEVVREGKRLHPPEEFQPVP